MPAPRRHRVLAPLLLLVAATLLAAPPVAPAATAAASRPAAAASLLEPTLVTLHVKDATARAVFAEVARQTGCEFTTANPALWDQQRPPVTIALDNVPAWAAVREACERTGLFPQIVGDRKVTLTADRRGWMDGMITVSGPFLLTLSQVWTVNNLRPLRPDDVQRDLRFAIGVVPEAKLRVLRGPKFARLESATDDAGNSLLPDRAPTDAPNAGGPMAWMVEGVLAHPKASPRAIASVKGTLKFLVVASAELFDVPDIAAAKDVKRKVNKRELTVQGMKKGEQFYEVRIVVAHAGGTDRDEAVRIVHPADVQLLDAQGRPLGRGAWFKGAQSKQHVEFMFQFTRTLETGEVGEPARFVWQVPAEVREAIVPFEFTNVPIPR